MSEAMMWLMGAGYLGNCHHDTLTSGFFGFALGLPGWCAVVCDPPGANC
jgi:hypothetical protein